MKIQRYLLSFLAAATLAAAQPKNPDAALGAARHLEEAEGNYPAAIEAYKKFLAQYGKDRVRAAKALVRMGQCYEKLGDAEARKTYERVVREFADQKEAAAEARQLLAARGGGSREGEARVRRVDKACWYPSATGRFALCSEPRRAPVSVRDLTSGQERGKLSREDKLWREAYTPVVSPDGTTVAYVLDDYSGPRLTQIRLAFTDGSPDRLLMEAEPDNYGWNRVEAWSADGTQVLALARPKGQRQSGTRLTLIPASGGGPRFLPAPQDTSWIQSARFSPDGNYVVCNYRRRTDSGFEIALIALAGGEPQTLVRDLRNEGFMGWAPDGRLVWTDDRSASQALWAVRLADGKPAGEPELIRKDIGNGKALEVGPSGELYYSISETTFEVYGATLDGSRFAASPSPLPKRNAGMNFSPDYSRDGKSIVYVTGRWVSGGQEQDHKIVIRNLETGKETFIPSPVDLLRVRWYPDGSAILLQGYKHTDPSWAFFRLDLKTSAVTRLQASGVSGEDACNPSFSPDGRYLYFKGSGSGPVAIIRLDLQTGKQEEAFRPTQPTSVRLFALSPDATRLVVGLRRGQKDWLAVVPMSGGEPKIIYEDPVYLRGWSGLAWTADGRRVLHHVVDLRPDAIAENLWIRDVESGAASKLWSTGTIRTMAVHPNGRDIAIGVWQRMPDEIWMMEDLFPSKRQ